MPQDSLELRAHLDLLDERYSRVLALTPRARTLLGEPGLADDAVLRFKERGFVQLPEIVASGALPALAQELWPILSPLSFLVTMPHQQRDALSDGHRFRRVDPTSLEADRTGNALASVLEALGIVEFFRMLADGLAPLLRRFVAGAAYERTFFNLYEEGDYISAHNDDHIDDCVDVNFSVTLDGVGGLRILRDGYLEMQYDGDGVVNILGPRVWHDVPPLLRTTPDRPPRRLTITMRYV